MHSISRFTTGLFILSLAFAGMAADKVWKLEGEEGWSKGLDSSIGAVIEDGAVLPEGDEAMILTTLHSTDGKRSAKSLKLSQSPVWQNWIPIKNLGPVNLNDAPVLLTMGPDNYWMFGRYGSGQPRRKKGEKAKPQPEFEPEEATLEGFDIPLQTTRFPNQYNAPGGLKPGKGGYHAWQSRDMKNWVHHGPVTEGFSRWVTSAEMVGWKSLHLL